MSQMYEDFKNDIDNFSYWFPKIKHCGLPVPQSVWIPVPEDVMDCFFHDRGSKDDVGIQRFVEKSIMPVLKHGYYYEFFMKNGTFSDKFDFEKCHIKYLNPCEITWKLSILSYDSLVLGTGGNTEVVFRQFLRDEYVVQDNLYTIYNGMPLRPEIRVFYDFDNRKALNYVNYWDWNYCYETIKKNSKTDGLVYEKAYPDLDRIVKEHGDEVKDLVQEHMKGVDLTGIWSIDMMYCRGKWWLIDMATAQTSAYWNPKEAGLI